MKKKPQGNDIIVTIITVMIAVFIVITTIFFNKYQEAKEDSNKYQRLIEIYKKSDDKRGDTKKYYVKRLNKAEEELKKVKKETNYKGYNDKSKKEKIESDRETKEKIYDVESDDDLIVVKNNIEFSDSVDKPEILINEEGVGTITIPVDSVYEERTVGSIITSVLGSPYLSSDLPSISDEGFSEDNIYTGKVDNIIGDATTSTLNTEPPSTTNPILPSEPGTTNPILPSEPNTPIENPEEPLVPDNNQEGIYNPNPPSPGYTDEDGGRGSGGGGNVEQPPTEEPSDNGNTDVGEEEEKPEPGEEQTDNDNNEGKEEEVTPDPDDTPSEPEQPNENPDEDKEEKPSDNSDEKEEPEIEPTEPEEPSEPDDKVDEGGKSEETLGDKQPAEQPDNNTQDNDKTEEE